mmetsp:Transcript_4502/g.9162  ORF Transcript_4502/g.9162 Transcript_4502/m.9162 type:complete len:211 (+) Transcript_4502:482-1114(+)
MEHRLPDPDGSHQLLAVAEEGPQPPGRGLPPGHRPGPRLERGAPGAAARPRGGAAAGPGAAGRGAAVRGPVLRAQHPHHPGRQGGRGRGLALALEAGALRQAPAAVRGAGGAAGLGLPRGAGAAAGGGPRRGRAGAAGGRAGPLRRGQPRGAARGHAADRRPADDQPRGHGGAQRDLGEGDGQAAADHLRLLRRHLDRVHRLLPGLAVAA